MNKRKYVLRREDLYGYSSDFVIQRKNQCQLKNDRQKNENRIRKVQTKIKSTKQIEQTNKQNIGCQRLIQEDKYKQQIRQEQQLKQQIQNKKILQVDKKIQQENKDRKTQRTQIVKEQRTQIVKQQTVLRDRIVNKIQNKKKNIQIGYSSSINRNSSYKNELNKNNIKRTKSKQKAAVIHQHNRNNIKNNQRLNFSQCKDNNTARNIYVKKKVIKQKNKYNSSLIKINSIQINSSNKHDMNQNEQVIQIDSLIQSRDENNNNINNNNLSKIRQKQDNLTIRKQVKQVIQQSQIVNPLNYIKQIDERLYNLQTQIKPYQFRNKQLQQIIITKQQIIKNKQSIIVSKQQIILQKQIKLNDQHKQLIILYKQNKDLSDMLRDIQQLMNKKSIKYQQQLLQQSIKYKQKQNQVLQQSIKYKQKQDQYKIIQAQRDILIRKKQRQNQQIVKLNSIIQQKQSKILEQKHNQQFILQQNKQLIEAYQKIKLQLQQQMRINETQRFFKQLVQRTQQQTSRNNNLLLQNIKSNKSIIKCPKCNHNIINNNQSINELTEYQLNNKFNTHIKTYQDQIQYWKQQINFSHIQHQHQIENIKTILQCTFQKNIIEKQSIFNQQINSLNKTILIQNQLINNYKHIIQKQNKSCHKLNTIINHQQTNTQSIIQNHNQSNFTTKNHEINNIKTNNSLKFEHIQTTRTKSYLSHRKIIQEVLGQKNLQHKSKINQSQKKDIQNHIYFNTNLKDQKSNDNNLQDSLINFKYYQDKQTSILQNFLKKTQISDLNTNSKIISISQCHSRSPLKQKNS